MAKYFIFTFVVSYLISCIFADIPDFHDTLYPHQHDFQDRHQQQEQPEHPHHPAFINNGKDAPYVVKINANVSFGVWRGWGTSLAWFGAALGDRADVADVLFTTKQVEIIPNITVPGLGLNFARYNVGACSWNALSPSGEKMVQSPNIHRDRQVEAFWIDPSDSDPQSRSWNWRVDANQVALLKNAQSRGANIFQLFSNSPVWWMCKNFNPSGSATGIADNIAPNNYRSFAMYLANVALQAQQVWNVTFESVEAFNEPSSPWWTAQGTQEGCHFDPSSQAAVIPLLRQELDRVGLQDMRIAASDENSYTLALNSFQKWGPEVVSLVDIVDVHGYEYDKGPRDQLYAAVRRASKLLYNSEYGEGDASGVSLASNLNLDLHHLHPSLWTYWQVFDGGGWGLIQTDVANRVIQQVNRKYYVLAHFTRHILPKCSIIDTSDINTIAAFCSANHTIIIVCFNAGKVSQTYAFDVSSFSQIKGPARRWETNIDGGNTYSVFDDVVIRDDTVQFTIKERTINTFEIQNAAL